MQVTDSLRLVVYYSKNPFKWLSLAWKYNRNQKKNSSRTNRQTWHENPTNESETHLGILQQFFTMLLTYKKHGD